MELLGKEEREERKRERKRKRERDAGSRQRSGGPLFAIRATSFRSYR